MNHDPSPPAQRDSLLPTNVSSASPTVAGDTPSHRTRLRRAKNRKLFNKKREAFLTDLLRNMDILVYAELTTVYHLDCSFLRLLLRSLLQLTFLSPKPDLVVPPHGVTRPLVVVLSANLLCFIMHAFWAPPSAGEATRGYLHGSVAMDFIGQKALHSRIPLLLLDILILVLQLLCFGVNTTRDKAKRSQDEPDPVPGAVEPGQTLDMEERGMRASENRPDDIELQELNPAGEERDNERERLLEEEERLRALEQGQEKGNGDLHILNAFYSGQAVVASLCVPKIVREQVSQDQTGSTPAASGTESNTSGGTIGAAFGGGGRFGLRMRVGERIFRI